MTEDGNSGKRIAEYIFIIVFFAHKKYSRNFVKFKLIMVEPLMTYEIFYVLARWSW